MMTIKGHGIDLVEMADIEQYVSDQGWLERCFTAQEIARFPTNVNRFGHIAGRFAAKEAVLKALGVGFGGEVAFTDIVIDRAEGHPPTVTLTDGALDVSTELGITDWELSIAHSQHWVTASAIASAQ